MCACVRECLSACLCVRVYGCKCTGAGVYVRVQPYLFSTQQSCAISGDIKISDFMKTRSVEAELFHANRHTDRHERR
jgi:hypothetical protein